MDASEVIARLRHSFEEFGAGNREALLDFLAEDVVIKLPLPEQVQWRGTHVGKEKMAWYLDRVAEALEFEDFELLDVFGGGERYAVHMRERVRVKSTGKRVDHEQVFLYRIRNGRIVEYQEFGDTAAIAEAFAA